MFVKSQAIGVFVGFAVTFMASSLAAVDDCPKSQFWNGTLCISCSPCPRGFGVKTRCSQKKDTECVACHPGFDYSNTDGFERCFGCDEFSNCPLGNSKEVKKCTIYTPRECDGCQDGNYFNPNTGCQKCSPPCRFDQEETTPCTTEHDRKCSPKTTVSTTPTILSSTQEEVPTKSVPSTSVDTVGTVKPPNQIDRDSSSTQKTSTVKNPFLWLGILVPVTVVTIGTIFGYRKRKRNKKGRGKRDANIRTDTDTRNMQEMLPLMSPNGNGLDLPIKDLTIDGKTFIAQRLNGKDNYGYYYWQSTAENLGFLDECKAWETAENPTEKLLKAYGEKAGSTIRNLIKALKDPQVGLTQFANEIEVKFSSPTTQDQKEGGECNEQIV